MSEWWTEWGTYRLSDFLMFSARTYFRQFELMNRDFWPLQLPALGAGAVILACMLRARPAGARIAFALLGLAWLWTGWAYHLQRYADINTGAPYFALGFFIQAGLLAWMVAKPPTASAAGLVRKAAVAVLLLALAAYPLLAPLGERSWRQAEVFGFAPDPTALATLGALLFWRAPWPLWVIPLLWCAASSATLLELHAAQAWLPLAIALLAFGSALLDRMARSGAPR